MQRLKQNKTQGWDELNNCSMTKCSNAKTSMLLPLHSTFPEAGNFYQIESQWCSKQAIVFHYVVSK